MAQAGSLTTQLILRSQQIVFIGLCHHPLILIDWFSVLNHLNSGWFDSSKSIKLQKKVNRNVNLFSLQELAQATNYWISIIQHTYFKREIKPLKKKSKSLKVVFSTLSIQYWISKASFALEDVNRMQTRLECELVLSTCAIPNWIHDRTCKRISRL